MIEFGRFIISHKKYIKRAKCVSAAFALKTIHFTHYFKAALTKAFSRLAFFHWTEKRKRKLREDVVEVSATKKVGSGHNSMKHKMLI